ncbi:MAG: ATP-binding protein, partial [Paludibacter sp.]
MTVIFGYDDFQLKDMPLMQLVDHDCKNDLEEFLQYNGSTNQSRNKELKCIKKGSSTIYVDFILNYVVSEKVIYGVAHDVTESKLMQKKNIIKAIIQTEEKEKSYFSKELHDGLGPLLSTIKLYLQWSKRQNVDELREEIIQKAESILEEALITVTEISNKLSPHLLEDYGLSSAVQSFMNKLKITTEIKFSFQSNMERRVDAEIEAALYRAIIECVNNTIKHAQANSIEIKLNDTGSQILLNYKDDGIGYNYEKVIGEHKGLGLFNLKNRIQTIGGNLKMMSEPGKGVDYQIQVNV